MKSYKPPVVALMVILIILQPFLAEWLKVGGISISFVLYFIMLFAFTKKPAQSFVLAVVLGLVYDMMYSVWLGKMVIILVLATALVTVLDKRIYRENIPALVMFFFFAIFLLENINTILEVGFGDYIGNFIFIQSKIVWMAVYSGVLSILTGAIYFLVSLKGDRRVSMKGMG